MNTLTVDLDSFFKSWQNKTPQETELIKLLNIVIQKINEKNFAPKISSIYLFGSFARREMRKESDIDIKIVVNEQSDLLLFIAFKKEMDKFSNKRIGIGIYSLEQLKRGKFVTDDVRGANTPPDFFIKYLPTYLHLCGKRLEDFNFPSVSDKNEIVRLAKFVSKLCESHDNDIEKIRMIAKQALFVFMIEDRIKFAGPLSHSREVYAQRHNTDTYAMSVLQLMNNPQDIEPSSHNTIILNIKHKLLELIEEFS